MCLLTWLLIYAIENDFISSWWWTFGHYLLEPWDTRSLRPLNKVGELRKESKKLSTATLNVLSKPKTTMHNGFAAGESDATAITFCLWPAAAAAGRHPWSIDWTRLPPGSIHDELQSLSSWTHYATHLLNFEVSRTRHLKRVAERLHSVSFIRDSLCWPLIFWVPIQ